VNSSAKPQADPGAEQAYAAVKEVQAKLPLWARKAWRWRILYIRAMLDAELKANGGAPNEACLRGFRELMRIYHTNEKSDPAVKPPLPYTTKSTTGNRTSEESRNKVIEENNVMNIGDAELAVVLGGNPSPAARRVVELLAERIKDRSGIALAGSGDKALLRLVIGTVASNDKIKAFAAGRKDIASLGADGYCIAVDARKPELHVAGQSDSGVVAGVGRLMREMRYKQGRLELPSLEIAESPQMPNRGMYLWARKHYFNHPDRVDRYIEELALWGCNAICLWFEMGLFESFGDTELQDEKTGFHDNHRNRLSPQEWLALYRRFYKTARRMGMKTGLIMVANDAYRTSPKELRIRPIIGCPDWYMCPSKPGSVEQMVSWQEEVFKALAPIDIYNIFPADSGGCSCKDCTPWPTHGLWRIARPLAERIHAISPKTEIWVDTWHLNHPTFGGKDWKNLVANLAKDRPAWFAGFEVGLAPKHKYAAMNAREREYYNQAKAPLMVFPDISMWGNHRGMLVNKAYWKTLQAELNDYSPELIKGGWPYSERWNTDIASVVFLSWFWNSKKTADTVLDEYSRFYFGPEARAGRELLDLLDDSCGDPKRKQKIRQMLAELDSSLPEWVRSDWRWHEIVQSCRRFE